MQRTEKMIVLRQSNGDELLFSGPLGLSQAQLTALRSISRDKALREFGQDKVREAEQTGLALKPFFAPAQAASPRPRQRRPARA